MCQLTSPHRSHCLNPLPVTILTDYKDNAVYRVDLMLQKHERVPIPGLDVRRHSAVQVGLVLYVCSWDGLRVSKIEHLLQPERQPENDDDDDDAEPLPRKEIT